MADGTCVARAYRRSMDIDIVTSFAVLLPLLAGLALIDSLSFGTLAIPVWLMMTPGKLRASKVMIYLATIGGFYFVVGVVLLSAARFASLQSEIDWSHPVIMLGGFVVGAGLLILSFVIEPPKSLQKESTSKKASGMYIRLAAWRQSAVEDSISALDARMGQTNTKQRTKSGTVTLMSIAVTAGVLEVATMLPYLAAIGLLTASAPALGLGFVQSSGLLAAYCVIMLVPALTLFLGRTVLRNAVSPLLERIDGWFAKNGQSTIAWVIGAVGVILMLNTWSAVENVLFGYVLGKC